MENNKSARSHTLNLENRQKMRATGIVEVLGFSENSVHLLSDAKIIVVGAGLKITRFSKDDGILEIEGMVDSIRYTQGAEKVGFIKRLLK